MKLPWRWRRSGPTIEQEIVARVRPLLSSPHQAKILKLAEAHTVVKRASDGTVLGYRVTILLDPSLGVP